ncbi:CarD family transcriptional regulator [Peptoniphilus sp. KCTC 25270]|uniref:CarD family transcriptional regulator n=1 Tax=Peptoniphilus sp. KCTC 25270 TaxID=2897414 RepID=UPI001E3F183E|nr:CarD family transcriptional regulator [Peptoniphilus sp. KCTC 25270]MCD1146777.1 CarD family transcriptional regulator [Peptoniphilus sp. KCTC 25270]
MFHVGDRIVYPIHGAGVIKDIETREILGEKKEYYILKMPINDMEVMVPVGHMNDVGIRDIMTKEEMDKVVEVFKNFNRAPMPGNWNRRYRHHQEVLKSGELTEIAEVVKNLEYLDLQKSLSTGERKMLNTARQIIISEMVLVYDSTFAEITKCVDTAIQNSGVLEKEEES